METNFNDLTSIGIPVSDETSRIENPIPQLSPNTAMLVSYIQNEEFRFLIDKPVTIVGRNETADILLNDWTVSRNHAKIIKNEFQYIIEDTNSLNGTYVNGKSVSSQILNNGDIIQLGKYKLVFYKNP